MRADWVSCSQSFRWRHVLYTFFIPTKKHSLLHIKALSSWFPAVSSVKAWIFKPSRQRWELVSFTSWFRGVFPVWRLTLSTLHRSTILANGLLSRKTVNRNQEKSRSPPVWRLEKQSLHTKNLWKSRENTLYVKAWILFGEIIMVYTCARKEHSQYGLRLFQRGLSISCFPRFLVM